MWANIKDPNDRILDFDSMFRLLKNLLFPFTQVFARRAGGFSLLKRFFASAALTVKSLRVFIVSVDPSLLLTVFLRSFKLLIVANSSYAW